MHTLRKLPMANPSITNMIYNIISISYFYFAGLTLPSQPRNHLVFWGISPLFIECLYFRLVTSEPKWDFNTTM